jgi:excisionase family DNA binding protein
MSAGGYLTVTEVARRLKLHPRTILRFIRDGRLKATQVGRGYRVRPGDLSVLEGVTEAPRDVRPSATVAVDLGEVDPEGARRWTAALNGAFHARPSGAARLSLDVVHDPVSRRLKVLMTGEPGDIAGVLGLVQALWEGFSS